MKSNIFTKTQIWIIKSWFWDKEEERITSYNSSRKYEASDNLILFNWWKDRVREVPSSKAMIDAKHIKAFFDAYHKKGFSKFYLILKSSTDFKV
jgi:hypothetical protein